jgi:hypothetical protein
MHYLLFDSHFILTDLCYQKNKGRFKLHFTGHAKYFWQTFFSFTMRPTEKKVPYLGFYYVHKA